MAGRPKTPESKARQIEGLKNRVSFKKGFDPKRNLKGRPPKLPHLEALLAKVLGEEVNDVTATERILLALRDQALNGDIRAIELFLDRGYGKLTTKIDADIGGKVINVGYDAEPTTNED